MGYIMSPLPYPSPLPLPVATPILTQASVEITSRYDGVVRKIHGTVGDMVQVNIQGSPQPRQELVVGVETLTDDVFSFFLGPSTYPGFFLVLEYGTLPPFFAVFVL